MTTVMKPNNIIINAECMRDFCGSFYGSTDWNRGLIEVIPEATEKAFREDKFFGYSEEEAFKAYRDALTFGFEMLLKDERTSSCMHEWMETCDRSFTDDEVALICDVYYIYCVSAHVEKHAIEILKSRGLKRLFA